MDLAVKRENPAATWDQARRFLLKLWKSDQALMAYGLWTAILFRVPNEGVSFYFQGFFP